MNGGKTPWVKATASDGTGNCVELRRNEKGEVEVRDSKDPDGPVLRFTSAELAAWIDGAAKGEFGHLIYRGFASDRRGGGRVGR
jgi:hypothetical protein